ncbi:MAG TPA: hypothetical protein VIM73_07730 [Polyangiaceae bacterium]
MTSTSGNRKARPGSQFRAWQRAGLGLSVALITGCDVVQGFQSAGDTLFPEESTHLSAPGLRLLDGGYRELRFASAEELYLLARSPEDENSKLYAMRYSDPHPCSIAGVGRYTVSFDPSRKSALIAYFQDYQGRGTLRFADTACRSYDMLVEDANLPLMEIPKGFVVRAGSELLLVDPQTNRREVLATNVEQVVRDAFGGRHIVRTGGRLQVFTRDWTSIGTFGEELRAFTPFRQSFVVEDRDGIFRLDPSTTDAAALQQVSIVKGGCALGRRSDAWITYEAPCGTPKLYAYHERTRQSHELGLDARSQYIQLIPALGSTGEDPARDAFWYFFLREIDGAGLGRLVVRTPDGTEHELGSRALLSSARLVESSSETYGYALTDISEETGTLVWWNRDGVVRPLAQRVLRDTRRTIIDYEAGRGNLAAISGDRVTIVARGVPREAFEYEDEQNRWTAFFHEFDGTHGRLSLMVGDVDGLEATPLDRPVPAVELETIAPSIPYFGAAWMTRVLPGIMYFSDYDPLSRTGSVVYRNLELRFTGTLNHGISDFIVAEDEVIYSIPFGESAGVWVVQGK